MRLDAAVRFRKSNGCEIVCEIVEESVNVYLEAVTFLHNTSCAAKSNACATQWSSPHTPDMRCHIHLRLFHSGDDCCAVNDTLYCI